MKVLVITFWRNGERLFSKKMNAEGRYSQSLDEPIDRVTIEPDDKCSKVEFTSSGAVYRP